VKTLIGVLLWAALGAALAIGGMNIEIPEFWIVMGIVAMIQLNQSINR
jgi:hypothetical protein